VVLYKLNIEHQSPHHKIHWGYKGAIGPSHWGDMDEKFSMCGKGKMQTPINIVATKDISLTPLVKWEFMPNFL
jgi:carbonic anhydrase